VGQVSTMGLELAGDAAERWGGADGGWGCVEYALGWAGGVWSGGVV